MKHLIKVVIASLLFAALGVQAGTINVIVNKASAIDSLDSKIVRKLYLGKSVSLPAGEKLMPLDINAEFEEHEAFCEEVIGKSPANVSSHWSRQIFNGKGVPPMQFNSFDEIIEKVAGSKEYIGYVIGAVNSQDVKVVLSIEF